MTHALRFITLFLLVFTIASSVSAQERTIIRDVEIEKTIKSWLEPLLEVAGMGPESVNIVLVQSDQLNAFVAGGANIFIYTGLIEKTDNPGELVGVLAHELGHISGGHLIGQRDALKRASYESILGTVLGIGAAILTGDGRAATAITLGAQGMATSNLLSHSRVNESAADQAGIRFMEAAKMNPTGLMTFFEKLEDQELRPVEQQDEYVRTHPLTQNRILTIEERVKQSAYANATWPTEWKQQHARMLAKLKGYIHPERIVWDYNDRDQSFEANYARAIAAYRTNKVEEALKRVNALIEQEPDNPYLYELKGQMLVDFGRVEEALPALQHAVREVPESGLFRTALGHALLNTTQSDKNMREAIQHLEFAQQQEPRSTRIHRLLATAYGRKGDDLMAKINLAEEAALQSKFAYAHNLAQTVHSQASPGSTAALRAYDLLADLKVVETRRKK